MDHHVSIYEAGWLRTKKNILHYCDFCHTNYRELSYVDLGCGELLECSECEVRRVTAEYAARQAAREREKEHVLYRHPDYSRCYRCGVWKLTECDIAYYPDIECCECDDCRFPSLCSSPSGEGG
jgi:hypothetical protein